VRDDGIALRITTDGGRAMVAAQLRKRASRGWCIGTEETLELYGAKSLVRSAAEPELLISLLLSRDRMHHSIGWWRNAEYEYCWHLSVSAITLENYYAERDRATRLNERVTPPFEDVPRKDLELWTQAIFGEHVDKLWNEPGGTDPRLTPDEKRRHSPIWHLRLFLDPQLLNAKGEPHVPFIPNGEVYDLTRWIPGLTPEKVDR
jgi:hypothetical protein